MYNNVGSHSLFLPNKLKLIEVWNGETRQQINLFIYVKIDLIGFQQLQFQEQSEYVCNSIDC